MSLGKISDAVAVGGEFEGLTEQQIKEKIVQKFSESYGRYENVSGAMWVEIYHNEGDQTEGQVRWRKGIGDEVTEDKILTHPHAILKFMDIVYKGYALVFKGVTQEDMDKGNALRKQQLTAPQREGWLGSYYKGKSFFRISTFKRDEYYVEYGYDGATLRSSTETEGGARYELDLVLADGYHREGDDANEFINPLEAFGLGLDTIEAKEEEIRLKNEPADGDLPDSFFELMK